MYLVMEITETNTNKVQIAAKVDPELFDIVSRLAAEDERSMSNMIERLLKRSPQVQELMEPATVAVGN